MKKILVILSILAIVNSVMATEWHAWGVHEGTVAIGANGKITSNVATNDNYHWNKSNWDGRIGQKAFVSTNAFNGMTVGDALQSISYDVTDGYWGDVYFNIMVQDSAGNKAILAPAYNTATTSGFATDGSAGVNGDFSVFEAQAGWIGTTATGWYAAEFDDIKNLTIANGPFTEFPDTLNGDATEQNDTVYSIDNWAAWANNSAGFDCDWEQDGFLFAFGQSTSGNSVTLENVSVNGFAVTPEPATMALLGLGGLLLRRRKA